jgi:hypothetical protein
MSKKSQLFIKEVIESNRQRLVICFPQDLPEQSKSVANGLRTWIIWRDREGAAFPAHNPLIAHASPLWIHGRLNSNTKLDSFLLLIFFIFTAINPLYFYTGSSKNKPHKKIWIFLASLVSN